MKAVVCLAAAALLAPHVSASFPHEVTRLLDTSVDPCDDFYQYSCGGWLKNFTLPSDRQSYSYAFNRIGDRADAVIQQIVKENKPLVGELWDSCMAMDSLTAAGNKPLQPTLAKIQAVSDKHELLRLAAEIGSIGPSMLAGLAIAADAKDATANVLYASNGMLTLPAASYYLDDATFEHVEPAYRNYITTVLTLAGIATTANGTDGQVHAENVVVAMEKAVAEMTAASEQARDPAESYNPLTYAEAAAAYPLAFGAMGDGMQLLNRSALTPSSKVVFSSLVYFASAETLLHAASLDDLRLYLAFLYVNFYASYLGEPFVQARFELYSKQLSGLTTRPPRARVCTNAETALLPDLIGKFYYEKSFDDAETQHVQRMVDAIETAMGHHIATADWLDDATRAQAQQKLRKVANLIGRATASRTYPLTLSRDDFFSNVVAIHSHKFELALHKLGARVDRTEWGLSAASVNAYYAPSQNQMVFPAAILQPPFYSTNAANTAQNFGGVGAVIGHELTHGFDDSGRHFDGDGNQREWWTNATAAAFEERAQCLRDQYSTFVVRGDDSGAALGRVDGNATIGENIADNGGVGLAWDALRASLKRIGGVEASADAGSSMSLPVAEQLFFVAFGQVWCGKTRDGAMQQQLMGDAHAPPRFRVNGVAMNSAAFARAFQCKRGAKMNPETKCTLW